ncbi:hypothetical protein L9W92_08645 [Pelotomaculum terephthalicicum JT]|nr:MULTISPECIES: hypothetical protein [Pelotomaculum]MCG9968116.1 hypothetical protein [Pelotomaculum terephthalicicum JT]OPX87872.1 MAG: hypothetical protein A4E54_01455 [Pelotomaculum sp. PtaB.Bin117]OPY64043.1 MAG: hypothetical protein A4E56_00095 [Pelotomaculum sp. PtaU1.Bin065]
MIPRKKNHGQTPDPVTSPADEECDICQEIEEDCCADAFVSKNDKKSTK